MFHKKALMMITFIILLTGSIWGKSKIESHKLNGNWHLRVMDGMDVRKARAILDFDMQKMKLSGFDGCNRMGGSLQKNSDTNMTTPSLMTTRMACRAPIHNWVSKRLHETLNEGFSIKEDEKHGIDGITIKSPKHELFLKKMGEQ